MSSLVGFAASQGLDCDHLPMPDLSMFLCFNMAQVEHPASSSSSLPASRAPPCVASPFPSIRWISGRATAPATSPRSREKDAQEDRSLCTAVLKIELAFLISGCRLIPSIPRSRPEDRSEPTPSIAAGEFLGLPSSFKLRRRTHDLK
uniref:Uncharacterized protein n=1 Tax=Oryza nivara TaxID=4536 RepID=A0A0E0GSW5_ORYNI